MVNNVVLIGRLTKDPELRYIPNSGTAVATFSLAIDRDYTKKDGTKDTDFIPIEVIGKTAEFCANYLSKGRLVAIQGSIKIDRYQTQAGENKTFTKVNVRKINVLDFKNNEGSQSYDNSSAIEGFQAIDDDDIPLPF